MPELFPEDQRKVDEYLRSNVNQVERQAFKPFRLLGVLLAILLVFTLGAFVIGHFHGVL